MEQAAVVKTNEIDALLRQNGFDPALERDNSMPNSNNIDLPRVRIDIKDNGSHKLYVDLGESYNDAEGRELYLKDNKLEGVICISQQTRAFWKDGDTIPHCSSIDGNIRSESPVNSSCITCPESVIGANCKPKQRLLMISKINDKLTPLILNLPPTSLKHYQKHLQRLSRSGLPLIGVNTVISLVPIKKNGYQWGELEFSISGVADKEMLTVAKQARDQLKKFTEHIAASDYKEAGDKVA